MGLKSQTGHPISQHSHYHTLAGVMYTNTQFLFSFFLREQRARYSAFLLLIFSLFISICSYKRQTDRSLSVRTRQYRLLKSESAFCTTWGHHCPAKVSFLIDFFFFFFPRLFREYLLSKPKKATEDLETCLNSYLNHTFCVMCKLKNLLPKFSENFLDIEL